MNIANLLHNAATQYATRPALTIHDQVIADYRRFAKRVRGLGAGLRDRYRLSPGDRVALAMSNHPEFYEVLFAVWHAGLVAVPVNARLHPREMAYILENSGARVCVAGPDLTGSVTAATHVLADGLSVIGIDACEYRRLQEYGDCPTATVAPDQPAWIFYTSGTTGLPKGAVLTHRNLLMMTLAYYADIDAVSPEGAIIHAAPMSHGSGLYGLAHVARAANNVVPESGRFDAGELWELVRKHPGASFFAAPTMVKRLVADLERRSRPIDNLGTVIYGGAPMYVADLEKALEALGPRLAQIYGQGESPMTITGLSAAQHAEIDHPCFHERLTSVGYPRTGVEVRVVDQEGRPVSGERGEVVVRGDVVMSGYWQDPVNTARALRDGWLYTGDVGAFEGDGFLVLKDRSKDLIITGGTNVYPREVEEVLLRHPAVMEVAVVGVEDQGWGEAVVACVVPEPGAQVTVEELDRLCLEHIARFKRPKRYQFLDTLPRNNYGKVPKARLHELLADRDLVS
ncbi:MAG TPA: AMP-binding protein [Gammaproteobacteria bacterium]|nr:AMP-binding protein [Gammaproteobacteria bacterium]